MMTPFEGAVRGSLEGSHGGRVHVWNDVPDHRALHHYAGLNFGLQALGEQWLLRTEGDAWVPVGIQEFSREAVTVAPRLDDRAVAKAPDLTATVMLSLPTDRLRSAE